MSFAYNYTSIIQKPQLQFTHILIAFLIILWYTIYMFSFIYKNIDFAHKLDGQSSPTEEYYKHIHPFYEILYFLKGNVQYTVESETRTLNEGDIVFIPAYKYHFATVDLSVPYERYVLKLPESLVPHYISAKLAKNSPFYVNSRKFGMTFGQLDTYMQTFSNDEIYTLFTSEVSKLMVMLCHETTENVSKHNDFIKSVIDYINQNVRNPITTQTLAEEFHYSKSFINFEFKKHMKIPIMQFVRSKKIMAAHQMILSGAKKSEVAEMFGFDTYSTFFRAYKKLINEPGEASEHS